MLGVGGRDVVTYPKPDVGKRAQPLSAPATSDEFDGKRLGLQWQWNHNPDPARWSLSERRGYMRLRASRADDLTTARNTLTQRVQGPSCEGSVVMEVSGLEDGNVAGFGIFEFPYAYVCVRQEAGERRIVMCNDGDERTLGLLEGDRLWVRVRVTDRDFRAMFYYSLDGREYHPAGELDMGLGLPWTANRFALFNFSTTDGGVGGYADFDWFRFTGK